MNMRILPVLGLALIAMIACSDAPPPTRTTNIAVPPASAPAQDTAPARETDTVITTENLARIAAQIYLSPGEKAVILAEARMTEETFMALVEQLSLDAAAAHRYAEALEVELAR